MSCLLSCLTSCFRQPNPVGYQPLTAEPVLKKRLNPEKTITKRITSSHPFDEDVRMSKILEFAVARDMARAMVLTCKAWRFHVEQFCKQQCESKKFPAVQREMRDITSRTVVTVLCYVESYAIWCQCKGTAFGPNEWQEYLVSQIFDSEKAVLPKEEVDAFFSLPVNQRKDARLIFVPMQIQQSQAAFDMAPSGISLRKLGELCGLPSNATKKKFRIEYDPNSFAQNSFPLTDQNGSIIRWINKTDIWPGRWLGDQTKKPLWIIATPKTQSLIRQILLNFTEFVRTGTCFCNKNNGTRVEDSTLSKYWKKYTVFITRAESPLLWVLPDWPMQGLGQKIPPSP